MPSTSGRIVSSLLYSSSRGAVSSAGISGISVVAGSGGDQGSTALAFAGIVAASIAAPTLLGRRSSRAPSLTRIAAVFSQSCAN